VKIILQVFGQCICLFSREFPRGRRAISEISNACGDKQNTNYKLLNTNRSAIV